MRRAFDKVPDSLGRIVRDLELVLLTRQSLPPGATAVATSLDPSPVVFFALLFVERVTKTLGPVGKRGHRSATLNMLRTEYESCYKIRTVASLFESISE